MWFLLVACTGTPTLDTDLPTDTDTGPLPDPGAPWVALSGGSFLMGSPEGEGAASEHPQHAVTVRRFAIMEHEVLATDYAACVAAGACPPAPTGGSCVEGDEVGLPQNCLDSAAAADVCAWLGGRLPSESEWEYAATSEGQDVTFPWGEEPPDCERANVVQAGGAWSCPGGIWEVCTHPAGDTPLGLCDMAGNLFEWTADWFADDYLQHPTDGSPQTEPLTPFRSMRGGGVGSEAPVRVRQRTFHPPDFYYGGMGVRCAMDL